jgi:phosphate transport system substrate-binding protein
MKHTLVVVAFSTLVSCSPTVPATTPATADTALRFYATTATLPLVTDLTSAYSGEWQVAFETRSGNYRITLERLLDGETSYFITNHLPPPDELAVWAAPIAQDGIAVIVHPDNPITNLTTDQLRSIYQGRVSNWQDLGGSDLALNVISREDGSGTRNEFEQLVMGNRQTTFAAMIAPSSEGMIELVARTPGSIGYVSQAFLNASVRAVSIDGITPILDHIFDNTYPLRSTIFVAGLQEPQNTERAFIGWMQSSEGQQIIAQRYSPLLDN